MTHETIDVIFLKSEARACFTYIRIAQSVSNGSHRDQALNCALQAYATVRGHLTGARLSPEERSWFDNWIERIAKEISSAQP